MGITVDEVRQQTHLHHDALDPVHHLDFAQLRIEGLQRLGDDVTYGHPRIQRCQRILEYHLDLFALFPQLTSRQLGQILPQPDHLTFGGRHQADDGAGKGGFTTTGLAHHA